MAVGSGPLCRGEMSRQVAGRRRRDPTGKFGLPRNTFVPCTIGTSYERMLLVDGAARPAVGHPLARLSRPVHGHTRRVDRERGAAVHALFFFKQKTAYEI